MGNAWTRERSVLCSSVTHLPLRALPWAVAWEQLQLQGAQKQSALRDQDPTIWTSSDPLRIRSIGAVIPIDLFPAGRGRVAGGEERRKRKERDAGLIRARRGKESIARVEVGLTMWLAMSRNRLPLGGRGGTGTQHLQHA